MSFKRDVLSRFEFVSYLYNPTVLKRDLVIQFHISDGNNGSVSFFYQMGKDKCEIFEGQTKEWDSQISTTIEYWKDLQAKKLGKPAVLRDLLLGRKIVVDGDRRLFLKFGKIFGGTVHCAEIPKEKMPSKGNGQRTNDISKVLVLNGSSTNKKLSATYHFSQLFCEGLAELDRAPEIELVNLDDLDFRACVNCLSCWKNLDPAVDDGCIHDDDFTNVLIPRLKLCDLLILSYPINNYNTPPLIQKFLTRQIGVNYPLVFGDSKNMVYPDRYQHRYSLFLLINCAGRDAGHMNASIAQMAWHCKRHGIPFWGQVRRTTAYSFTIPDIRTPMIDAAENGIKEAAQEIAGTGQVTRKTRLRAERQTLTNPQIVSAHNAFVHMLNKKFKYSPERQRNEISRFDISFEK